MKSPLLPVIFLTVTTLSAAQAQDSPERRSRHYDGQARAYYRGPVYFTAGVGAAFYNGDLGSSLSIQQPGASLNLGVLYSVHPRWTVGSEVGYFQMGATDYLPERGLAFRSRNGLGTAFLRFEPLRDEAHYGAPHARPASLVKPYLKLGVGVALYGPKSYRGTERPDDNTRFLTPERGDYPAVALVAPVGAGVTVRLTPKLNATIEGAYYFTTSDQLDDISPASGRSTSAQKDGFGLLELKLEYAPWAR